MAADLSLKVDVDGSQAKTEAQNVGKALTDMSEKGDAGAKKVSEGMKKMGHDVETATKAVEGHGSRASRQFINATRAAEDYSKVLGLPMMMGGLGRLIRGTEDLGLAMARGGVGMAGFTFAMVAFNAATQAVMAPINALMNALKEGFGEALGQEKLDIQLKNMLGSAKAAGDELKQIKDFVTGGQGGFLSFDDAQKGVERLQSLSGGLITTSQALRILAGAQAVSGQSAAQLGQEIGKVTNYILSGTPMRYQMLEGLVNLHLISSQDAVAIENMSKKHADATAIMGRFTQALHENDAAAKEASESFGGLMNQLEQIIHVDILEPLGAALIAAFKEPLKTLDEFFTGHQPQIQEMAMQLRINLMTAIDYVKEHGIEKSFYDGLDAFVAYFEANVTPKLQALLKHMWDGTMSDLQEYWDHFVAVNKARWQSFIETMSKPPTTVAPLPGTPKEALGLGGQPDTRAEEEQRKIQQDLIDAQKAGEDATKNQTSTTKTQTSASDALKNANNALKASVDLLNTTMQNMPNMLLQGGVGGFGPAGAAAKFAPPVPGATPGVRAMQYGPVVGEYTGATLIGPFGNVLKSNDIAVSVSLMQQFGLKLGDYVNIIDQTGKVLYAHMHIMDTSWKTVAGRKVDTGGFETRTGKELGYASLIKEQSGSMLMTDWGKLYMNEWNKAQKEQADQTAGKGKLTGVPKVEGKDKATKDLSEEKSLTDQLNEAEKKFGTQIEIIEQKRHAHMITDAQAYQEELNLYKQEQSALENVRAKLEAAYQAAQKAHDTKLAEQYKMKLDEIDLKLLKITADLQKVGAANSFWGQAAEEATKKSEQLAFTGKSLIDNFDTAFQSISGGFMSIIDGSQKASDAFKQMAKEIIDQLWKIGMQLIESQLMKWLGSLGQTAVGTVGGPSLEGFGIITASAQTGGMVTGPGGIDRVPTMLTSGEYVLHKGAVDKYGIAMIDAMNKGTWGFAKYAGGGSVGGYSPQNIPPSQSISGAGGVQNVTVATTINMGGSQTTPADVGRGGGSGLSKEQIAQFQTVINNVVREEIVRQKRPGGILNRNTS